MVSFKMIDRLSGFRLKEDPDCERSLVDWCKMLVFGLALRGSTRFFR